MAELSPLRRRMIEDMTVRNLSPATQRSYLHAVAKFSRYFGRSPDRLGLEDVRAFQVHLASTGISWAALNQTVCALRFFYGVTLGHGEIPERIPYARTPRKLPTVLSGDEVVRFLEAVAGFKTRTALVTAYAAGLRASEVVRLKVADVDSRRMVLRIEQARAARTAPPCFRRGCSPSCAATGDWRGRGTGCFPAATRAGRSMSWSCIPPAARPALHLGWVSA
jgi:site-specific recombinase XerD